MHRRITGTDYEMNDKMMWLNLQHGLLPMFSTFAREITRDTTKKTYVERREDLLVTAESHMGDPHISPSTSYDGRALNAQEGNFNTKKKDVSKKCSHCNWYGHFAKDCPNKDRTDRCSKCHKIGHEAAKCRSQAAQEQANNVQDSEEESVDLQFGFVVQEDNPSTEITNPERCNLTADR